MCGRESLYENNAEKDNIFDFDFFFQAEDGIRDISV